MKYDVTLWRKKACI